MPGNPGINILDLGPVYTYITSHYSYYKYNISSLKTEYLKIGEHRTNVYKALNEINSTKNKYKRELETYVNILDFNYNRLTNRISDIFIKKRNKRGLIDGLGSIIKAISGNLDADDGKRYEELFEKINKNQEILEKQNLETIRLNKDMTAKFNKQIDSIRHNEIVLESRIMQINVILQNIMSWQDILVIKDILNQLILLIINLIEITTEIESSLTFCNLNKIHNSIITLEELKTLTNQITDVNFWDLSSLITSHCKIENNEIEYLLEIPMYEKSEDNKLLQITPIPMVENNELFILDSNKQFIIQKQNKLVLTDNCNKINEKYYCQSNYIEANKCFNDIIFRHHNRDCKYHKILENFVIVKIENSNIVIITSKDNKNLNIRCQNYIKHIQIIGTYKFKTDKNCVINEYKLENYPTKSKEIIFENFHFKIESNKLTNKTIKLEQLHKQNITFKEIAKIESLETKFNNHSLINTAIIVIIVILLIVKIIKKIFIQNKQKVETIELQPVGEVPF